LFAAEVRIVHTFPDVIGSPDDVPLFVGEGVDVTDVVAVGLIVGELVGDGVDVTDVVAVGVPDGVAVGLIVGELVGDGVDATDAVAVGELVGDGVDVTDVVAVRVPDGVAVGLIVGELVGDGVDATDVIAVGVPVGVQVGLAERELDRLGETYDARSNRQQTLVALISQPKLPLASRAALPHGCAITDVSKMMGASQSAILQEESEQRWVSFYRAVASRVAVCCRYAL
jgi:hypothetical protein